MSLTGQVRQPAGTVSARALRGRVGVSERGEVLWYPRKWASGGRVREGARLPSHRYGLRSHPIPGVRVERRLLLLRSAAVRPVISTVAIHYCDGPLGEVSRFLGNDLIGYFDDLIFAAGSAREAVASAQQMIRVLSEFGWLIHPTKCDGVSEAAHSFVALGTLVDLATRTYAVPPATVDRMLHGISALLTGPPRAGVRAVARVKGLITSSRIATGSATRISTRAMDTVIMSRPDARAPGLTRRARRRVWDAAVLLTDACREELAWWADNLRRMGTRPIRETPSALPSIAQSRATRVTRASGPSRTVTSTEPRLWTPRWSPPSAPWRPWA